MEIEEAAQKWSDRMKVKGEWNEHASVREHVLWMARHLIVEDRHDQYGPAAVNFAKIANLWNAYLGLGDCLLSPEDVAMMMVLFKCARIRANNDHQDNFIDAAGYVALASEMAMIQNGEIEKELGSE